MSIKSLFNPKSAAVIGTSRTPGKLGHQILHNIIEAGYKGDVYPINPKADEILGLKCYPSITRVPKQVELAVVAVHAKTVPSVIEDCGKKGVKTAVVISSGFGELGGEGKEIERKALGAAERAKIRILGPNCQGVNDTSSGLCASWPLVKAKGQISIISQSGTVGAALGCWAADEGIGIAKLATLGNKTDIDESELLDYLAKDRRTRVIALYLEGIANGRRFLEVAKKAARKKPVVVLKGGRTKKGIKAVLAHTQSLAGRYEIFQSACRQVGLINVSSVEELYDVCKGFACLPKPKGKNTVVITSSGGSGVLAADASEELGLKLVNLPEKAVVRLKKELPPECIVGNPLDLTGSASSETYKDALKVLTSYNDVHSIVLIVGDPVPGIAGVIQRYFNRLTLVPVMLGGGEVETMERAKLKEAHIPVYPSPSRGIRALAALI